MTASWTDLPATLQDAVTRHIGVVRSTADITGGKNNDLAVVVYAAERPVFVKGVVGVSRRMRMLRNEITAGELAAGIAPAVLFAEDVDDWLIVGFDHLPGRPADLAPGSPDLPRVADVVNRMSGLPATGLRPLRDRWRGVDWWRKLADEAPATVDGWDVAEMSDLAGRVPELVAGDRLLHTDLHGDQFLLGDDTVHVIDWGFPGAGAPWVDSAFLVLRLIEAGHPPHEAEAWARHSLAPFAEIGDETMTAFAAYLAGMWTHWAVHDDQPGNRHRARLARTYAAWRR